MKRLPVFLAVVLLGTWTAAASARPARSGGILDCEQIPLTDELPARAPGGFPRADTLDFGYFTVIGGQYYAVQGETWTWDHGSSNLAEGWYAVDESVNPGAYFRQITEASWEADSNNPLPAPIIAGAGSLWLGLFESDARALCWDAGLGYGSDWCQRLEGPTLTYTGTGEVTLSFLYFNDSEAAYDYTHVLLRTGSGEIELNPPGFDDRRGAYDAPLTYTRILTNSDFGGGADPVPFQVVFVFTSDAAWSDQDGDYPTSYGPLGVDDLGVAGNLAGGDALYGFESDLEGWSPSVCPAIGSFFGIAEVSDYLIQDPCGCELQGKVAEFHDALRLHPAGQMEAAWSPPADRTNLQSYNRILADWDQYAEMPKANGVFYRAGFNYYPFVCPSTGESGWSGRLGHNWYYVGDAPACYRSRSVGSDWGVPASSEQVGFVYEVYSSCEAFGIPSTRCSGETNFTPIIDNVRLRMTTAPLAPIVDFETGAYYQDGFGQGLTLGPTVPGNADITYNIHRSTNWPDLLGDSLVVKGPSITSQNRFSCKLWLRIRREGPGASSIFGYTTWKNRVRDGLDIVGPHGQFCWGWMDSSEVGTAVYKNKYVSNFREDDDSYYGPHDWSESNEIILDGILGPGTQIEYFVTSAYVCTPTVYFYLPDTTGGFYREFEILPSFRDAGGYHKFPCVLYIDAQGHPSAVPDRGSRYSIENALNAVLNGAGPGDPIPNPTTWDRYDYVDAASNWQAPLFRNIGGNAGASLPELFGYRCMILDTGALGTECLDARDWQGFEDWLTAVACGSNQYLQAWYGSGDNLSRAIQLNGPSFLANCLGAVSVCDAYNASGCPSGETDNDENWCVRLDPVTGGPWQPEAALDLWGNWCPPKFFYDVLGTAAGGVANKTYHKVGSATVVEYAQVVHDASGSASKYRTVLSGYGSGRLARRDADQPGPATECPSDSASVVDAVAGEIRAAIGWTLNLADPMALDDLCLNTCLLTDGPETSPADGGRVNRLDPSRPNPFNPRTTIRFSLAQAGPASLVIHDVNGRKVKTLVTGRQSAGPHTVVWDGTDDADRPAPAGIYWSLLTAGDYRSSRKMVVLK